MPITVGNTAITFNDSTQQTSAAVSVGVGQSWQNVTSSRSVGTTYTNSTGKPIMVVVAARASGGGGGSGNLTATVGGVTFIFAAGTDTGLSLGYPSMAGSFIVPNGSTYRVAYGGITDVLDSWVELR